MLSPHHFAFVDFYDVHNSDTVSSSLTLPRGGYAPGHGLAY